MADDDLITPTPDANEPPNIDALLNWDVEAQGEIPPELQSVSLDQFREVLTERTTKAAEDAAARERAQHEAQATAAQAEAERRAAAQSDIEWAADIDTRLASADETVRTQALLDKQNGADRYVRGLAAKHSQSEEGVTKRVIEAHYSGLFEHLKGSAYEGLQTAMRDGLLQQHGGNPLLAAVEYGKTLAGNAEYERGKADGARDQRIAFGRDGAPDTNTPVTTTRSSTVDPTTMSDTEYREWHDNATPQERGRVWAAKYAVAGAR